MHKYTALQDKRCCNGQRHLACLGSSLSNQVEFKISRTGRGYTLSGRISGVRFGICATYIARQQTTSSRRTIHVLLKQIRDFRVGATASRTTCSVYLLSITGSGALSSHWASSWTEPCTCCFLSCRQSIVVGLPSTITGSELESFVDPRRPASEAE